MNLYVPRRCPSCGAVERSPECGVYLCGYRDDGQGRCWDLTKAAVRAVGREHAHDYQDPSYPRRYVWLVE